MPTTRTRRRREQAQPNVIKAIETGAPVEYSPEAWVDLISAFYFRDHELGPEAECRARVLLDEWRELQYAYEREAARGNAGK